MINTGRKKNFSTVVLLHMTREFSSTFSRINRQTSETSIPTEKCFKLAQKPCGRVGKRKYNLRTFARNFSNIDFFLKLLPLKDDELAMSEM